MKKIIRKFWGVALIVVLLSTLFIGAVPVVNAGTLAWGAALGPTVAAASDVNIVKVAPNGDIFAVDNQAAIARLLKSTDGGYTWTAGLITGLVATDLIADVAISPDYTNDKYVYILANSAAAAAVAVYQSADGGATFARYGALIGTAGTHVGTSIALEPTFHAGVGQVMVGAADVGAGTFAGNVYIWTPTAFAWVAQGLAEDITAVAFSPSYPIDKTIFAVGSLGAGTGTRLHIKVFTNAWDAAAYFPVTTIKAAILDFGTGVTGILSSSLAFPSGFNASTAGTRTLYVGTNNPTAGNDDAYSVTLVPAAAGVITALAFGASINNVAYSGTTAAGTIYAGAVATATYKSLSTAPLSAWVPGGAVTGATNAYVAPSATAIYVGTTGAESAFNVSTNGGLNFIQTSLIDTVLSVILDFQPYSATEWYLVTQRAAGPAGDSLWKTTNGGTSWTRIYRLVTPSTTAAVRLSAAYSTDKTLYLFETGATAGAPILWQSPDAGATWTRCYFDPLLSAVGVNDVVVVDKMTLYAGSAAAVAGAATVFKTTNAGFWWTAQALPASGAVAVFQIKRDATTGHLLAGTAAGGVYLNALAAVEGFVAEGATGFGAVITYVAFDSGYGTNHLIYAGAGAGAVAGVWRFDTSTALTGGLWKQISGTLFPAAGKTVGIVVADGVLYAADSTAAAIGPPEAGGVVRVLNPTAALGPWTVEQVSVNDGLTALNTLASLVYTAGSNILLAIENSGGAGLNAIKTYTDTFTTATPEIASPTSGAIVSPAAAVVIINSVTGALGYSLQWNDREDFLGTGNVEAYKPFPIGGFVFGLGPNGIVGGGDDVAVPSGATIYYKVRITAPVIGLWSQLFNFKTQLAIGGGPAAPGVMPGAEGTTGPGGYNVGLMPTFNWGNVVGATSFEFQLGKSVDMTGLTANLTGANALGAVQTYKSTKSLSYATTYYWRVRGISPTSNTDWTNVMSFTTMSAPVTTTPSTVTAAAPTITVSIPTAAAPTVTVVVPTQPTPTTVVEKVSPTYIWAIIIIGAILVIAVIVLIVRTRRAV
jgi:hypothetical protein